MFNKIGFKLIFIVGVTVLFIIGGFAFINITSHSTDLLNEVERHANQLSETVKYSTRNDMMLNQRDHIHQVINTIGEQPGIRDVRILNKVGKIIYSTKPSDIGKMVNKRAESCYACHAEDKPLEKISIKEKTRIFRLDPDSSRVLGVINPIYNDKSCWQAECHAHSREKIVLGVLDVTISLEEVDKQIQNSEMEIAVFAVISILIISFIIAFFVKRWVDKPVNVLLAATKQVADGNLNYKIEQSSKDEIGKLAGSFNNMTKKLSEARLQLFHSDKLASLGRLAAGVAHEINNPLTGVLTYSSFLLKRTKGNPELQEDLNVIVRETLRSREIVKSLLDFARQSVPKKSSSNIHEIIERAIGVVENQLSLNKIVVRKNFDAALSKLILDANQMQQAFINLLVNAADAIGKKGGTINITTSELKLSPLGLLQIKKAQCSKRHSLIDNEIKIDGKSSVKIKVKSDVAEGFINLDPIYGKHKNIFPVNFNSSNDLKFVCPECETNLLIDSRVCPQCGSGLISFTTPPQGTFECCSNQECNWQSWDLVGKESRLDYLEIKISDTGCGIAKEEIDKIFEPFFSTKGQRGTGLGLAVIWGIIDNHDGIISVESEISKGTTFSIKLPIQKI